MGEGDEDWLDDVRGADDLHLRAVCQFRQRAAAAIEAGDDAALRRDLAEYPGLVTHFNFSESLLNRAAELGRAGAVAALLEAGAPPDLTDESGGTPLMAAAWDGHLEVARLLLDAGADPDILLEDHCHGGDPEVVGRSALFFALAKGHRELIDLLEPATRAEVRDLAYRELPAYLEWSERNPPPHVPTVDLYRTVSWGRPDLLRQAIAAGGDVNHRMPREACSPLRGGTPLSWAAAMGRMDLVGPLLAAGADPGLLGHDGRSPADLAELNGHLEVAERLRTRH
jgi:protein DGCR14